MKTKTADLPTKDNSLVAALEAIFFKRRNHADSSSWADLKTSSEALQGAPEEDSTSSFGGLIETFESLKKKGEAMVNPRNGEEVAPPEKLKNQGSGAGLQVGDLEAVGVDKEGVCGNKSYVQDESSATELDNSSAW